LSYQFITLGQGMTRAPTSSFQVLSRDPGGRNLSTATPKRGGLLSLFASSPVPLPDFQVRGMSL
jgi:hypothetical protein